MTDLRLHRIIALFDSPNIFERSAAFARADEIVRKDGQKWAVVLRELFSIPVSNSLYLSNVEFGHVEQCRDMLRRNIQVLTTWERNFLMKLSGVSRLTERQVVRLQTLAGEIELRNTIAEEFGDVA